MISEYCSVAVVEFDFVTACTAFAGFGHHQ